MQNPANLCIDFLRGTDVWAVRLEASCNTTSWLMVIALPILGTAKLIRWRYRAFAGQAALD